MGNLSLSIFCDRFVSKQTADQFFKKAKDSNLFMLFMDDLKELNLVSDLANLIPELLSNKEALEDLLGVSKNNQTEMLFGEWIENLKKTGVDDPIEDLMAKIYRIFIREKIVNFIEGEHKNLDINLAAIGSSPQKRV